VESKQIQWKTIAIGLAPSPALPRSSRPSMAAVRRKHDKHDANGRHKAGHDDSN
jgi:hypothetical protein